MQARAIVFQAPGDLSVQTLDLRQPGPADVEVEVSFTGISTGTERLLWDGTMPPFPGLAYPLVPGYETVGTVVKAGPEASAVALGDTVFVPGSYSFFGGAEHLWRRRFAAGRAARARGEGRPRPRPQSHAAVAGGHRLPPVLSGRHAPAHPLPRPHRRSRHRGPLAGAAGAGRRRASTDGVGNAGSAPHRRRGLHRRSP